MREVPPSVCFHFQQFYHSTCTFSVFDIFNFDISWTNFSSINIGFYNGNKFLRNDCPLDFSIAYGYSLLGIVWLGKCPLFKNSWLHYCNRLCIESLKNELSRNASQIYFAFFSKPICHTRRRILLCMTSIRYFEASSRGVN